MEKGLHNSLTLNEAERLDISREKAEEVIDKLNQNGRLMRPTGYDTLQIV